MAKKSDQFESWSIDYPLIEIEDVHVPCDDVADAPRPKPLAPISTNGMIKAAAKLKKTKPMRAKARRR